MNYFNSIFLCLLLNFSLSSIQAMGSSEQPAATESEMEIGSDGPLKSDSLEDSQSQGCREQAVYKRDWCKLGCFGQCGCDPTTTICNGSVAIECRSRCNSDCDWTYRNDLKYCH